MIDEALSTSESEYERVFLTTIINELPSLSSVWLSVLPWDMSLTASVMELLAFYESSNSFQIRNIAHAVQSVRACYM